jgi:hypothetical protein
MKASGIIKNNEDQKLEAKLYMSQVLDDAEMDKVHGGFEGKFEQGKIVHFKHWISKKL